MSGSIEITPFRAQDAAPVGELLARARSAGVHDLYLLTLTAEDWFPRFGFEAIPRDQAPEAIRRSDEFTTLCPDTAVLMRLEL